jgi:hypothetical protein
MIGKKSTIHIDDLVKEVTKVKAQIRKVSTDLNNPELELAASVRLNVRQRELEAYLHGILFALGEVPAWQDLWEADGVQHATRG